MSYSSYSSKRRRRKRQDPLAVLLAVLSVIGLPVLGFAAYKLFNRPPTVIVTTTHIKAPPSEPEKSAPAKLKTESELATASGKTTYGPGPSSGALDGPPRSIADCMDRLAEQMSKAVIDTKTHQVLLVWLLDSSASNDQARGEVVGRFDDFYSQLAAAAAKAGAEAPADKDQPAVLSAVAGYGKKAEFLTSEPTGDWAAAKKAAEALKSSTSHVENTFAALQEAVQKFSSYRLKGRFVSFVVVSDETGDDEKDVDKLLPILKRYAIPVYCIGVEASFAHIAGSNQMSEGRGNDPSEIRVRQGPETRFPDWIHLQYPDGRGDTLSVGTGLGPYTLARLCQETDGEYFALPQIGGGYGGDNFAFDQPPGRRRRRPPAAPISIGGAALPRKYAPVYVGEQEVQAQLAKNKAKQALVEAAKLPEAPVLTNPEQMFAAGGDDAERQRALDRAQRPAAKLQPAIDSLYKVLKTGEADEPKLAGEPRWQAAYDLAYGRASAAKARLDSYMSQTAVMKAGRKLEDPKHTQWVLELSNDPTGNSVVDKMAAKARELLERVVKEHPGTPWAASAEHELQMPMTWKWVEQ